MWLNTDVQLCPVDSTAAVSTSPACECGAHLACCRTRISMMNDSTRNNAYIAALTPVSSLFCVLHSLMSSVVDCVM